MTADSDETGRPLIDTGGINSALKSCQRSGCCHAIHALEMLTDLSTAPVAQEPVAWVEFTEAGLIRFWTSDPARAEAERARRSLTKFSLSELIALVGRPRIPPATPAGVGAEEIALTLADHFPDRSVKAATEAILALLSRGSGSDQK